MTASDLPPPPSPDSTITERTVIAGAQFRAFYLENWPKNWFLEDCEYAIDEETTGEYCFPDDGQMVLGRCGYMAWQGPENVRPHGTMYPLVDFYRAYAERSTTRLLLVNIDAVHEAALEEFVAAHGGTVRSADMARTMPEAAARPDSDGDAEVPEPGPAMR